MQAEKLGKHSAFFQQPIEPVGEILEPPPEVLELVATGNRQSGDRPSHAFLDSTLQLAALGRQTLAKSGSLAADLLLAPTRCFRDPVQRLAGLLFGGGGSQQSMAPKALENPGRGFQGGSGSDGLSGSALGSALLDARGRGRGNRGRFAMGGRQGGFDVLDLVRRALHLDVQVFVLR